jgi:hypothetical protein
MKALLLYSLIAVVGWTGEKRTTQPCTCPQAIAANSDTLITFTLGRYALHNVSMKEARKLSTCLSLNTGMTFHLDSAFYESLCACNTKRHCLKSVKTMPLDPFDAPLSHALLVLEYEDR